MKLIKAFIVAHLAHRGQVDKAGKKYVKHAIRVSRKVKSKQAKMVALLHDVVEDTSKTIEDIEKMFGRETAFQVSCLTKIKGEVTEEYIKRVKQSPVSIEVKLADLLDNMNVFRLKKVEEADLVRLKKYLLMYYELAKEINTVQVLFFLVVLSYYKKEELTEEAKEEQDGYYSYKRIKKDEQ